MDSNNKIWGTLLKVALGVILVLSFLQVKMKFGWDPLDRCYLHSDPILIESITLSDSVMNIEANNTQNLLAQIEPANATNKNLKWSSSDTTVAIVEPTTGMVIATGKGGECIIMATATDGSGKSADIKINVNKEGILVDTIISTNSNGEITLNPRSEFTIDAKALPENAANKTLAWKSDNEDVATVNDGVVTGKSAGVCTISASSTDGGDVHKSTKVRVLEPDNPIVKVTSIVLDELKNINVGGQTKIHAKILPANAANKTLKWETSNRSVATVNNGVIVGVGEGECTIRATSTDGGNVPSSQCAVSVKPIVKMKLPYGEWKGDYLNGKPNGQGTIVFDKSVLVTDVPDDIYAHKGYTFRNVRFENGKLKFGGILYDSDGREIKRILSDIKL